MTKAVDAQSSASFFMMLIPPRRKVPPDVQAIASQFLRFKDSSTAAARISRERCADASAPAKMADIRGYFGPEKGP
jgi:hypothetical protein